MASPGNLDLELNFAKVKASSGYDASATSINLEVLKPSDTLANLFPDPAAANGSDYNAVWYDSTNYSDPADDPNHEIVRITAKSGSTYTVTRAQDGTSATTKNTAGSTYVLVRTPTKRFRDLVAGGLPTFNVEYYGAVGDGTTDCYQAFLDLATAVNAADGGIIIYPPGTYLIDQHITGGDLDAHINFKDCSLGVHFIGYGVTIRAEESWTRSLTNEWSVTPIKCIRCNRVTVEGFELDGSVDTITKSGTPDEGQGIGLAILGCTDVLIHGVYAHHWHTDGIFIDDEVDNDPQQGSRRTVVSNCWSKNNARGALLFSNCRNVTVIGCTMEGSGNNLGTYGAGHPPLFGIDIEPDRTTTDSPAADFVAGSMEIINCRIIDNGRQFICQNGKGVNNVQILNTIIDVGTGYDNTLEQFIFAPENGQVIGGMINVGSKAVRGAWGASGASQKLLQRSLFYGVHFKGSDRIFQMQTDGGGREVIIDRCLIESTASSAVTTDVLLFSNLEGRFTNNRVIVPSAAHPGSGNQLACSFSQLKHVYGNRYTTDFNPSTTEHFYNNYAECEVVRDERFLNDNADAWRPTQNATFEETIPWSRQEAVAYQISTGAIALGTDTSGNVEHIVQSATVTTESGSSDDLDSINGGQNGQMLTIMLANEAHRITVRGGSGNIVLTRTKWLELNTTTDRLTLIFDGTNWYEISRSVGYDTSVTWALSSDALDAKQEFMIIDSEDANPDNLDNINQGRHGQMLTLRCVTGTRTITVRDNAASAGNIYLNGGVSRSLDNNQDTLTLIYNDHGGDKGWFEVAFSSN